MRAPARHPRVVRAACRAYGVAIWLYPSAFRRAFGLELAVTFRNRVEDVSESGGILDWFAFAVHIALDWIRTCSTLMMKSGTRGPESLLGLSEGYAASGCIDRAPVDAALVFAVAGLVFACVGWYTYFAILPSYAG